MKELLENVLPYLGIEPEYTEEELKMEETREITVPNLIDMTLDDAKKLLTEQEINFEVDGDGNTIRTQFPPSNEIINYDEKIILYTN